MTSVYSTLKYHQLMPIFASIDASIAVWFPLVIIGFSVFVQFRRHLVVIEMPDRNF